VVSNEINAAKLTPLIDGMDARGMGVVFGRTLEKKIKGEPSDSGAQLVNPLDRRVRGGQREERGGSE
jgi:hypothetical protein